MHWSQAPFPLEALHLVPVRTPFHGTAADEEHNRTTANTGGGEAGRASVSIVRRHEGACSMRVLAAY